MKTLRSQNRNAQPGTAGGPLGDYPRRFRKHLQAQHYSPSAITAHSRCVEALGQLMSKHGVDLNGLSEKRAVELIINPESPLPKGTHPTFVVKRFFRFLIESGAVKTVPSPKPDSSRGILKRRYEEYLRHQRGLSERTILDCWRIAERFLKFRFGEVPGDLSAITPGDIVGFQQSLTSRCRPYRCKTASTRLRSFFQYLFKSGRTAANLALGIPSIAQRYNARLPRYLSPEQVEALIAAVREDTPLGRRNYAMVLLLARLGLRAPEVIAMQIEDIDWRAGEIVVRGKGQRHDRLPLLEDVGEALAEYIRRDRVNSCRSLFVIARAPYRPFRDGQVLNSILRDAFARSGLKPPALLQQFFTDRLTTQMEASPHTIASYRDTFRLLLRFASARQGKPPTKLRIEELDATLVGDFLTHIETKRHNSARSRNTRLAAIRSFFRFVAMNEPACLLHCERILAMPSKRYVRRPVDFLERTQIEALLEAPDRSTWAGRRDHAILLVAVRTGLRVSELVNLRCRDFVPGPGAHLRCQGKGRKQRCTPLRPETAETLAAWLVECSGSDDGPIFPSIRGGRLSRDAVEHLVRKHVLSASTVCPSLIGKRVTPHVLRHSTAMELLQHGVDQSVIALWLGHESVETTQVYVHADLRLKEKALAHMAGKASSPARYRPDDELLAFLESL